MEVQSTLEKMLEQSRQMVSHVQGQLVIKRSLDQIEAVSRDMAARSSRILTTGDKSKAQLALAKKGFDTEEMQRKLDSLSFKATPEPIEFFPETDLEGYLESQHTKFIWASIEETKQETAEQGMKQFATRLESDWLATMEMISHSLSSQPWKENELETMLRADQPQQTQSFIPSVTPNGMNRKMMAFANVITVLNTWRFQARKQPFAVISQFLETTLSTQERDTERQNALVDSWDLLQEIVGEVSVNRDGSFRENPVPEAKYASESSSTVKHQFLRGSIRFLTNQYGRVILNDLRLKSNIAQIGGEGTLLSRIKGYLKILYPTGFPPSFEITSDGAPKFATLYYCCRVGDLSLAGQLAERWGDKPLAAMIADRMKDGIAQVDSMPWRQLDKEFTHDKADHFKHLFYNYLGKFDSKKSYTNKIPRWSVQDWLWFQLNMVNFDGESGSSMLKAGMTNRGQSLQDLQERITSLGPAQFNKGGQTPLLYFQVLIITQQFESAIDFLYNDSHGYQVEMVHFAIAMYYYGILRTHNGKHLYHAEKGKQAINFIKLLVLYVRVLSSDTWTALNYICLIRDEHQRNNLICELALSSRDFLNLFGSLDQQGQLIRYFNRELVNEIARETARLLEHSGTLQETVFLFDFLHEYESAIKLISNQMSKVLTLRPEDGERKQIIQVALYYDHKYTTENLLNELPNETLGEFVALCQLITFYEFYYKNEPHAALNEVMSTRIIPASNADLDRYINEFKNLPDNIRRNFSSIILTTMICIFQIYEDEKRRRVLNSPSQWMPGAAPEHAMTRLHDYAKTIVTYAGLNRYHMPADVYSQLMKLEVQMT